MTPELKKQWVEALRSGKYKQGKKVLRSADNTYCCLGVVCELLGAEWQGPFPTCSSVGLAYQVKGNGSISFPNESFLRQHDMYHMELKFWNLALMNDRGKSFAQIADYIEQHL